MPRITFLPLALLAVVACEQPSMVSPDVAEVGADLAAVLPDEEPTILIGIDIKPALSEDAEEPPVGANTLSINKRGTIAVALLGGDGFDVSWVDVTTVLFNGVAPLHEFETSDEVQAYLDHIRDVNEDGLDDLVLHFDGGAVLAEEEPGTQCLWITGDTDAEEPVSFGGCEEVKITGGTGKHGG
ncbi:MAG TPA: hypothetical protein VIS76_10900 [Pseudomonadales bacterium]